ncbi:MAG TPA: hypothetical protein DEA75_11405 [Rhodobacteraceae bacterium]|nr:hypothetical protein [Paracoccaceae bacterium]
MSYLTALPDHRLGCADVVLGHSTVVRQACHAIYLITEPEGRPSIDDKMENIRTSSTSWPAQFLAWKTKYHTEHHCAASVLFHLFPALYETLQGYVYAEKWVHFGTHSDIIHQRIGRKPRNGTKVTKT